MRAQVSPRASVAWTLGMYWVSICSGRLGPLGRLSSSLPARAASASLACDQKYGVKNATGPLKVRVFRNSVQQRSPVGRAVALVAAFAGSRGRAR